MSVDKTYRCAERYCPGLPYDPKDKAHPLTCADLPKVDIHGFVSVDDAKWMDLSRVRPPRPPAPGLYGASSNEPRDRRFWPVGQLSGTGPITDADVEAAETLAAALPSREQYEARSEVADDHVRRTLRERDEARRERDDARAEVARLTAELNAAHESGLTLQRANP